MYHRLGLVPRQLYVYDRRRDSADFCYHPRMSRCAICNPGVKREDDMSTRLIGLDRSAFLTSRRADRRASREGGRSSKQLK